MTNRSIKLATKTDPDWARYIVDHFDDFLADHANCERKASALAMSLIVKYPDREEIIPSLIDLAAEELAHFRQVYRLMEQRGLQLVKDEPDPYVNQLLACMRHGREPRFLDRLLVSSIIECRGAERFRLIANALEDAQLRRFYLELTGAETKHGHIFVDLASRYYDDQVIYARLEELAAQEADIIINLAWRASLH